MTILEKRQRAHDEAVRQCLDRYADPESGAWVFTEFFHRKRGFCCGFACRHCPYDHVNVGPFPDIK